jgi:nucleotide-binding universal stress UspA family protein
VIKKILIAVNDSDPATQAAQAGAELAVQLGASVALVHVVIPAMVYMPEVAIADERILDDLRIEARNFLLNSAAKLPQSLPSEWFMPEGDPAAEIVDVAEQWGADLIVMGTHARGRLAQLVLGSTAEAVVRHASCPVMVVHPQRSQMRREGKSVQEQELSVSEWP